MTKVMGEGDELCRHLDGDDETVSLILNNADEGRPPDPLAGSYDGHGIPLNCFVYWTGRYS